MDWLAILLWILAGVASLALLVLVFASVMVFFGAMALPDDLNDNDF